MTATDYLGLADYRRRVAGLYAQIRSGSGSPEERWNHFRRERDELFKEHPQSSLSEGNRRDFAGLDYFPYDPSFRFEVTLEALPTEETMEVTLETDGRFELRRVGRLQLEVGDTDVALSLYWIHGYGGGLFLPFRDATNGSATYGGGRYLLDTIKGVDLGAVGDRFILDFNFAYNPSCAYDARWHCPLPPQENWLEIPIPAGERAYARGQREGPDPTAIPQRGSAG